MSRITLRILSEYGNLIAALTNGAERSAVLGLTFEEQRRGGTTSAVFYLKEGSDVPLYTGTNVLIQEDGIDLAMFDIDGNPDNRGTEGRIEVRCTGLCERLKKIYITSIISGQNLKAACLSMTALASTVGVIIDADHIALPTDVSITTLELKDSTVYDFIETLITYANGSALQDKYAWKIDTEKRLVIYDATTLEETTLYEGYGFQSPSPEVSHSDQVNTIRLWRKMAADSDVEFVGVYTDDASIDRYGAYEKKIELSYYATDADCAKIAAGILARSSSPSRTISVSSLLNKVSTGPYRLFMKPMLTWERLYAGEDKESLDLSHTSGTVFSDDAVSMVGRFSTKCVLNAGAYGYVSLPITPAILLPKKARFFFKGTEGAQFRVILVDEDGDTTESVVRLSGDWQQLTLVLDDTARAKFALWMKSDKRLHPISYDVAPSVIAAVEDDGAEDLEGIFTDYADGSVFDNGLSGSFEYAVCMPDEEGEQRTIYMLSRGAITSLAEIRIEWITPSITFWVDYMDCLVKQWQVEPIYVNRVTYELRNDSFLASAEFGDEARTATDEITDLWSIIRSSK